MTTTTRRPPAGLSRLSETLVRLLARGPAGRAALAERILEEEGWSIPADSVTLRDAARRLVTTGNAVENGSVWTLTPQGERLAAEYGKVA